MTDHTVIMAVASYRSKAAAEADFHRPCTDERHGADGPMAAALVEKGADGQLRIDRHRSSTKQPAWDGAVLGSALTVLAAPLGIRFLVSVVDTGTDLGGVGAIASHLWQNLAKDPLRRMSELLESGQAALVVIAAGQTNETINARLACAEVKVVATTSADFARQYSSGVEEARAIG
jgi:uncharacterized membrane protein